MKDIEAIDILLVEDNPQDAELIIRALKKNRLGNRVYVAEDGAQAMDILFARGQYAARENTLPPRVILLDLKLPKVNGLEVLREIKSDEKTKRIPVVVVTSSREDPDIERAYALGANSYVIKPMDFEEFFKAMSNLGLYWLLVNQPPV
jgi:two-component system, response regulator